MTTTAEPITVQRVVPEIGIHDAIPSEVYHRQWDAVNKSSLDWIISHSPRHCRYHRDNPRPPTASMIIGSAFHTLILEPDRFDGLYQVAGQCCGTIKKTGARCANPGKVIRGDEWFCGVHDPGGDESAVEILTADQMAMLHAMREAVMRERAARELIEDRDGANEQSYVWKDPETGLLCKARHDMVRPSWDATGDLKTTDCASHDEFMRSIGKFGYHRQAAFYQDGARELGKPFRHFAIIAVEKEPPYGVGLFRLMDDAIEGGRQQIRQAMRIYADCIERDDWYGYASEFQDISITRWEMNKIIAAAA